MGEVGLLVTCVGFMLRGTCACILVGEGGFFFPSGGQGHVKWCVLWCLCLTADGRVCVPVWRVVG